MGVQKFRMYISREAKRKVLHDCETEISHAESSWFAFYNIPYLLLSVHECGHNW